MALTDNLISYYKLDESSGNASDSVGSNTLTNRGTTGYSSGKINNGAVFDGTNNKRLDISNGLEYKTADDRTWSFWVNPSGLTAGYFIDNVGTTNDIRMIVYPETNKITLFANGNTKSTATTVSTGNWYHIVVTKSGTTYELYMNGSSQGTVSQGSLTYYSDAFSLGAPFDGYGSLTNGTIDEVGIWSRALTSGEVTSLYNSGSGNQYPFSGGSTFASRMSLLGVGR